MGLFLGLSPFLPSSILNQLSLGDFHYHSIKKTTLFFSCSLYTISVSLSIFSYGCVSLCFDNGISYKKKNHPILYKHYFQLHRNNNVINNVEEHKETSKEKQVHIEIPNLVRDKEKTPQGEALNQFFFLY